MGRALNSLLPLIVRHARLARRAPEADPSEVAGRLEPRLGVSRHASSPERAILERGPTQDFPAS